MTSNAGPVALTLHEQGQPSAMLTSGLPSPNDTASTIGRPFGYSYSTLRPAVTSRQSAYLHARNEGERERHTWR